MVGLLVAGKIVDGLRNTVAPSAKHLPRRPNVPNRKCLATVSSAVYSSAVLAIVGISRERMLEFRVFFQVDSDS